MECSFFPFFDADMGLLRAYLEKLHNAEVMPFGRYPGVEFVDRREFTVMAPPDESLPPITLSSTQIMLTLYLLTTLPTLQSFENICAVFLLLNLGRRSGIQS